MGMQVLSKTKINDMFFNEIIDQIRTDVSSERSAEEKEILDQIKDDVMSRLEHGIFRDGGNHYIPQENEYNFLVQNDKKV